MADQIMRHEWRVSLVVAAPFTTGSTENAERGLDDAQLRDEDGMPIVAGTHLQGLFRHFLSDVHAAELEEGIADAEKLVAREVFFGWFGRPGRQLVNAEEQEDAGDYDDPAEQPDVLTDNRRARLTFRDLTLDGLEPRERHDRDRIRIDVERRSVRAGAWLTTEQLLPTGDAVSYSSDNALVLFGTTEEAKQINEVFSLFKESLPAIGGDKGAGFGKVIDLSIDDVASRPFVIPATGLTVASGTTIPCRFLLAQPLLVDPELLSGNLLRSAIDIPGAALKAALAEAGEMAHGGDETSFGVEFGSVLARIVVRHALAAPSRSGSRRTTFPFSLAAATADDGEEVFIDAFAEGIDELRFAVNFKERHRNSLKAFYPSFDFEPALLTRTRTAIRRGEFTAEPHRLFNHQAVSPRDIEWRTEFVVPESFTPGECDKVGRLLALFASDAVQIGKLRSEIVNVRFESDQPNRRAEPVEPRAAARSWRMKVDTPAWLLGIDEVRDLHGGTDLRTVYRQRMQALLGPARSAVDWEQFGFFAQHEWSGGRRAVRYKQQGDGGYYPYLLTRPGSVFRFVERDDAGEEEREALAHALSRFAAYGLPVARSDASWRNCPFVPENGFGEVTIGGDDVSISRRGIKVR
jgi:hypothetical protein